MCVSPSKKGIFGEPRDLSLPFLRTYLEIFTHHKASKDGSISQLTLSLKAAGFFPLCISVAAHQGIWNIFYVNK
jgi:hypothetical protein